MFIVNGDQTSKLLFFSGAAEESTRNAGRRLVAAPLKNKWEQRGDSLPKGMAPRRGLRRLNSVFGSGSPAPKY
jgi:hypothetical protein